MRTARLLVAMVAVVVGTGWTVSARAQAQPKLQAPTNDDCLSCHNDPEAKRQDGRSVAVTPEMFSASVHGQAGLSCTDCHADLATAELPHGERLAPAQCASCHDEPVRAHAGSVHGRARHASKDSQAAGCVDCHGSHDIRGSKDPESRTYKFNLPATCGKCHGNAQMMAKAGVPGGNVFQQFEDSIHGRALSRAGLTVAPSCADCHGAHDVKGPGNPQSRVYRTAIPATCGTCHEGIERHYRSGIHGTKLAAGNPLAPHCADCHTAHGIRRVETDSWKLQVLDECGQCHRESVRTYRDTYHGQVTSLGFVRVAKCADCHGAHEVFPKSDPRSRVSSARLVTTCRSCHPGATASFARYDPHADKHNRDRNPLLFFTSRFMEVLLVGVFAFFALHTLLWASRTFGLRRRAEGEAAVRRATSEPPANDEATE